MSRTPILALSVRGGPLLVLACAALATAPTRATATTLDLTWERTTNYQVRGTIFQTHHDHYTIDGNTWTWTGDQASVWNGSTAGGKQAWFYTLDYSTNPAIQGTHYWFRATLPALTGSVRQLVISDARYGDAIHVNNGMSAYVDGQHMADWGLLDFGGSATVLSTTSDPVLTYAEGPAWEVAPLVLDVCDVYLGGGVELSVLFEEAYGWGGVTKFRVDTVEGTAADGSLCGGTAPDSDGDGVGDDVDACPSEDATGFDLDADGCRDDTDGDGATDDVDVCPDGSDFIDLDGDFAPDACDICPGDALNDQDGDGLCTAEDLCPNDYDDGAGADDTDGDTVCNSDDICAAGDDLQDADADAIADACDLCPDDADNDADNDGVCGDIDICLGDDTLDSDADGIPDACDTLCPFDPTNDADFDGVCGESDICPLDYLDDSDGDGSCDSDDICPDLDDFDNADGDAIVDCQDSCPADVENDADGDGLCESDDNCEGLDNPDQADADADGIGNACEPDSDGDGLSDDDDNCDFVENASQTDSDGDGQGDACDADDDGDAVRDGRDRCPATAAGAVVLTNGCSVAQTCPTDARWRNHGAYVECVEEVAHDLYDLRRITRTEKYTMITEAALSSVGKKHSDRDRDHHPHGHDRHGYCGD